MAGELESFAAGFVLPLLAGGRVRVGRPPRLKDRDQWASQLHLAVTPDVAHARLRRAQLVVASPTLPDPDEDELSLWIALHNLLVFEHPDRARVWTRATTWRRFETNTRSLLALPSVQGVDELLQRHIYVDALLGLLRFEWVVLTPGGEQRLVGHAPQGHPGRSLPAGVRCETVPWLQQTHAAEVDRLLPAVLSASPLTCLLRPDLAPVGWSPLQAVALLRQRPYARAVCYAWAKTKDWTRLGGALTAALLRSLPAPTRALAPVAPSPQLQQLALAGTIVTWTAEDLGALVGALIHLHVLKVLELDTRVGVALGSRDAGVMAFLALPLLLPRLRHVLGAPTQTFANDPFEAAVARRWDEYTDHLEELIAPAAVEHLAACVVGPILDGATSRENLVAGLMPRVVQPA